MGPATTGQAVPFRVLLDGRPAGDAHGTDVAPTASGTAGQQRTYQLIRQPGAITERPSRSCSLEAGIEAYCFTFG